MARIEFRYRKYKNQPVVRNGFCFASKKEADRYQELRLLERAGRISDLKLQPKFDLLVNGIRIGFYKADFSYRDENGKLVVEDVKSPITRNLPIYRLKKKLMEACLGIQISEI